MKREQEKSRICLSVVFAESFKYCNVKPERVLPYPENARFKSSKQEGCRRLDVYKNHSFAECLEKHRRQEEYLF